VDLELTPVTDKTTEARHTPGPWQINFDPEDDLWPLEIVTEDRDHRIAFPASNGNPADAFLIAAAPDFAAGVAQMLANEDCGGDGWWKGWDMLKAAYAKGVKDQPYD